MRKLTIEELNHYEQEGYVIVDNVFAKEELQNINDEIEELERSGKRPESKMNDHGAFIYELALLSDKTRDFSEDERILSLIEDIVQPGIAIYSSKMVTKFPQSDTVCHWHQDEAYYAKVSESKTRMSIWVPLQDATEQNGCLWIVPGSHKQGLQPTRNKDYGTCRKALLDEAVDWTKAFPIPMKRGSIFLFSSLLWHTSKGNGSDEKRRAFIVSYQEAPVSRGNGKQWKVVRPGT